VRIQLLSIFALRGYFLKYSFMMIPHFQNDVVKVSYDLDKQLGMATWSGFLTSSQFKEAVGICLDLMDEHKLLRWLGDNRKLRAIRKADQDWFVEYVIPRLAAGTIRRNASVVSEDLFNRMAMEQIIKRSDNLGDMILKEFDEIDAAKAWLEQPILVQEQA
jgi:hypothetical protein